MSIFGRRRVKNVRSEFVPPVDVKEISEMSFNERPQFPRPSVEESMPQMENEERPFAPVFIKLTKYRQVLGTMNQLKMNVNIIKNQLAVLNELDKLREENLKLLKAALGRVDERLVKLDSSFMRPSGYMEEIPEMQMQEVDSLEGTIEDLKGQIENLRSEVENVG